MTEEKVPYKLPPPIVTNRPYRWKVSFFFALYDFWVGVYRDQKNDTWYICLLPCCVMKFERIPV